MSILLKTAYLTYEISENGQNKAFRTKNGEERLIQTPAASSTTEAHEQIPPISASFENGILSTERKSILPLRKGQSISPLPCTAHRVRIFSAFHF